MRFPPLLVILVPLITSDVDAANVNSTGDWIEVINSTDLISGAGSDLNDQYDSHSAITTLKISGLPNNAWQVSARIAPGVWDSNFHFFVRRTSDGTGSGTIAGGTSYVEITTTDTQIFSGSKNRRDITVQYKLTGMSVNLSPNTYSSPIIFSISP